MSAEKSWSLLDSRPVLKYISQCDDYIVYRNGIVMPHKMALCFGGTLLNIFPTPEMRRELNLNYRKLYYANAFETLGKWDHILDGRKEHEQRDMHGFLFRYIEKHLNSLKEQKISGAEVLGWFDYKRATIVNN